MRRIRIATLLLLVGLALPGTLLVRRALSSLAIESEVRHRAVAERTFDELERALSQLLREEENRPFEHYRFYPAGPAGERSSLAASPPEWALGYFQIDPDGSVHSPRRPRAGEPTPPGWHLDEEEEARIAEIEHLVGLAWRRTAAWPEIDRDDLATALEEKKGALSQAAKRDEASEARDAYSLLDRLNRGSREREVRKQKVEFASRPAESSAARQLAAAEADAPEPARLSLDSASSLLAGRSLAQLDERSEPAEEPAASEVEGMAPMPAAPRRASPLPEQLTKSIVPGREPKDVERIRVLLDPMSSRPVDAEHFILYRTVLVGEQGLRQGVVVKRAALGRWLRERVLTASELDPYVEVTFGAPSASSGRQVGEHRYLHQFAEPFEGFTADVSLHDLPVLGTERDVYLLAALLAASCGLGAFALYRLAAVALHFAERRSNFVAAVSHELKTPLTAIRMYAEMLREGLAADDAKRDEYYDTIRVESERLSRLVDNVLEFSRLEKGQLSGTVRVGDLGDLVYEVAETLAPHAERHGFALRLSCDEDLPPVRYQTDAVVQMLFNLVDNAIKYSRGAARREIVVECRRAERGVALHVRDFGPGVHAKHLKRIFEPFYRGTDERTRETKGTGIGLALVRDLARSMGAVVRGANAEGGGFEVRVAFAAAS